jgi:hypothetical protein
MSDLVKHAGGAVAPAVDKALADRIKLAWAEAEYAEGKMMRKIVAIGALLLEAKAQVKHGEFGPWLHANVFPDIPLPKGKHPTDMPFWRRATRWMEATRFAMISLEKGQSGHGCHFVPGERFHVENLSLSEVLSLPAAELSDKARAVQEQVFAAVDGKTLSQLTFKFLAGAPPAAGGDLSWEKFIRTRHPALIKDGVYPKRKPGIVGKEVWAEWEKHCAAAGKTRDAIEHRREHLSGLCRRAGLDLISMANNPDLKLVPLAVLVDLQRACKAMSKRLAAELGD